MTKRTAPGDDIRVDNNDEGSDQMSSRWDLVRVRGLEKKYWDLASAKDVATSTNGTGGMIDPAGEECLNSVQSTAVPGPSNRTGRQISMDTIIVKGVVSIDGKQTPVMPVLFWTWPTVFLALVLDKNTNEGQMTSEQVFSNKVFHRYSMINPLRNLDWSHRFEVLDTVTINFWDKKLGWAFFYGAVKPFSMYGNLKGMRVNFDDTETGVGAILDNSIHILGYTTEIAGGLLQPQCIYNSRLRYRG